MTDFLVAIGLILVIEGCLYAAFPARMQALMRRMQEVPPESLRRAGLLAAVAGLVLVWLIRG